MPSVTPTRQPGLSDGDDARVEALWQSHDEVGEWHLADDDDSQLDSLSAAPRAKPSSTRQRTRARFAQRSAVRNTFALRKPRRIRTPSGDERHRRIVVCRRARLRLEGKPKAALQQPCYSLSPQETRVRPQRVKDAQPAVPVASEASLAAPCVPPPAARSRLCLRGRNKEEALTRRRHWTHTGLDPPARCAAEAEREEAKPPYGYTGHRFESELGLTDAGGRFYDAKFGIFLSPDPIGPLNGGSTFGNRYAYVGYDPINFIDPTGFQAVEWWQCSEQPPSPDGAVNILCVPIPANEPGFPPESIPDGVPVPNDYVDCGAYGCAPPGNEGIPNTPGNNGNASKGKPRIDHTADGQMFGAATPTDLSSSGRPDGANFYDPDTGEWLNVGPLDSSQDGPAQPPGNIQIMYDPAFKGDPNQAERWDTAMAVVGIFAIGPEGLLGSLLARIGLRGAARGAQTVEMTLAEAAAVLKKAPGNFPNMPAFGKALGWGRVTGEEAFSRAATITKAEVKALGITSKEAYAIRDAYRAVINSSKGPTNPTALGRESLMNRVGQLLE